MNPQNKNNKTKTKNNSIWKTILPHKAFKRCYLFNYGIISVDKWVGQRKECVVDEQSKQADVVGRNHAPCGSATDLTIAS